MNAQGRQHLVLVIVAAALFMENLDSTVLATALPTIAADLHTDPVRLKLALTAYLVSLAVFAPASGWVADRFGARRIFTIAIGVFCVASVLCSLSTSLPALVAARALQGLGGAMMVPVGRLVILRTVPRHEFVAAMAWFTMPALLGPLLGPPVGGFIVTIADWRWIFWINVPFGIVAIVAAWLFMPPIAERGVNPFDLKGFLLIAGGLGSLVAAEAFLGAGRLSWIAAVVLVGTAALAGLLYVRHTRQADFPVIDLKLLRIPTFRAGVGGGLVFRAGMGATPFLLPLLMQLGFGMDPLASGMTTFATAMGAIAMKPLARPVLARLGFRTTLVANGLLCAALVLVPISFTSATPWAVMAGVLLASGLSRSLQFTAINAITIADVPDDRQSQATSFTSVIQQVSASLGVSLAALSLDTARLFTGHAELTVADFALAFTVAAGVAGLASLVFARLPLDAGAALVTRPQARAVRDSAVQDTRSVG